MQREKRDEPPQRLGISIRLMMRLLIPLQLSWWIFSTLRSGKGIDLSDEAFMKLIREARELNSREPQIVGHSDQAG
jgi:hypothetical protein